MKFKLVGKYNDLELGHVEEEVYYLDGLLQDCGHHWKLLRWIDENLQDGFEIRVLKVMEGMMEESQRKNKTSLDKIVKGAFRNMPE